MIDEAFHPEARRRLVASLKRREQDHARDLETQRARLEQAHAEASSSLMRRLEAAEDSHQTVLDQFANYKVRVLMLMVVVRVMIVVVRVVMVVRVVVVVRVVMGCGGGSSRAHV